MQVGPSSKSRFSRSRSGPRVQPCDPDGNGRDPAASAARSHHVWDEARSLEVLPTALSWRTLRRYNFEGRFGFLIPRALGLLFLLLGAVAARAKTASCPTSRTMVDIPGGYDAKTTQCLKSLLVRSVQSPNTIVRMGPTVSFDFSDRKSFPIQQHRQLFVVRHPAIVLQMQGFGSQRRGVGAKTAGAGSCHGEHGVELTAIHRASWERRVYLPHWTPRAGEAMPLRPRQSCMRFRS